MKNKNIFLIYVIVSVFILFVTGCEIDSVLYDPLRENIYDPGSDNYSIINVACNLDGNNYNVPVDSNIIFTFDRPVNPDNYWSISFSVFSPMTNNNINFYMDKSSATITWNSDYTELTINPENDFPKSAYVTVAFNNFISSDGKHNNIYCYNDHFYQLNYYTFSTVMYKNSVVTLNIINNAQNVPVNTDIIMTFDRAMNPNQVFQITLGITNNNQNNEIIYTNTSSELSWNAGYTILTIDPEDNFPNQGNILVNWNGFISLDDEYLVNSGYLRFTTSYQTSNVAINIDNGETNVPVNTDIIMTFDRPMNPDYNFVLMLNVSDYNYPEMNLVFFRTSSQISWNPDNTVLTINPADDLPASATVNFSWYGFESLDGEYFVDEGNIVFYTN